MVRPNGSHCGGVIVNGGKSRNGQSDRLVASLRYDVDPRRILIETLPFGDFDSKTV